MKAEGSILIIAVLAGLCASVSPRAVFAEERIEERVTLNTEDGWNLDARYLKAAESAPTVVLIHTQKSDHTEWEPWLKPLKRYGFGYLSFDLRGHGNSFVMPDGSTATWRSFSISGPDNEFNRMLRDVDAALAFLSTHSVTGAQIVLAGSSLGANLAIKSAAIHPEISMAIAISPALNVNDVLTVNPLRAYGKRPLLLIAGANRAKQYKEFQLLNDIARMSCGKDNVTVMVEASGIGPDLITKYTARRVLDWIRNPRLPELVELSTAAPSELTPAATDQAPAPAQEDPGMPEY